MNNIYKEFIDSSMNLNVYRYKTDRKYHLTSQTKSKVINASDGYAFEMPTSDFNFDYKYSKLRCKYFFNDCILTTSYEDKNPYTVGNKYSSASGKKGWEIYYDEWIVRYISHDDYLKANRLEKTKENVHSYDFLGKYELVKFSYFITDSDKVEYPYYNIAIIRKLDDYKDFFLFVMKSKTDKSDDFNYIINSFKMLPKTGKATNLHIEYEVKENPKWNKMTKRYFKKLCNQSSVDWGIFTKSLTSKNDGAHKYISNYFKENALKYDNLMQHNFELLPTYMHISWGNMMHYFPLTLCNKLAKGNGFNGKKVLHFTFQYTSNNNSSLFGYSPTFDILRGELDDYFHQLAKDIKKYHYPVLFRLNNEMNTDWTSYSGIASLLDPDIFIYTWKRLYDIFEQENVDNCIWIFNPIHVTAPFCNWGEYLNYYPEGMVHMLGLTSYERGNMKQYDTFRKMYKNLYKKNCPHFKNFPQIISEFGAGCGGEVLFDYEKACFEYVEVKRNLKKQSNWVKNMFIEFNKKQQYTKNIKAAIWFSANDYGNKDGKSHIMNYFRLDDELKPTLRQFKKGFKKKSL